MKKTICMSVSYNYFGDTVLSFPNEERDYSVFQHQCMFAKQLLERIKKMVDSIVFIVEDTECDLIIVKPAIPYLEEMIKLDEDAYEASKNSKFNDCAGAEIAGRYGY